VPVASRFMGLSRLKVVRLAALFEAVSVQSKKMQMTPCPKRSGLTRPPGGVPVGEGEGGKAEVR